MLASRFQRWLKILDREQFDALTDRKVWLFILVTLVGIIFLASKAPWVSAFFGMQAGPALWSLAPVALCAAIVSARPLERGMPFAQWGVLILATSGAFQFFMWALVCFSSMPGAAVMAALPILLCAYHGESFRFSKSYLWWALSFAPALALALLIAPTPEHLIIVSVGGLIAATAAWTMGSHGVLRAAAAKERDALKAAVDAQALLDSVREVEAKQHLLYELRGTNHDAGNALSGVLMNLEFLSELLEREQLSPDDIANLRDMNADLQASTLRLRALIEKGRDTGKQAEAREQINVLDIARQVVDEIRSQHPQISININADDAISAAPFVPLHGGELAFYRVLLNVVKNATEGNGHQTASEIEVVLRKQDAVVECEVLDNGPGFADHQLDAQATQLATTKASGTGLGLYTSLRLLLANRGELIRQNRASGGAAITIRLPSGTPTHVSA